MWFAGAGEDAEPDTHSSAALVRMGSPSALPAEKDKPFQRSGVVPGYQKGPLHRCFKPRRLLRTGFAGFASAADQMT